MIETLSEAPHPFKGTEIHTLANGIKFVLKDDPTVPVVAMQAWAKCGAINEEPRLYGISHGLEHMVFKGTPRRSAGEITRLIESNGGNINAATQLETTHYYIDIPSYGLKPALDVLADTILHPTFPQEELERERLVILEEIHRRDDSPEATLWDEFASHVFKDTPYGIKVIGSEETVSSLSREDLNTYFHKYYAPANLHIVIVGDFDKKKVLKQLTGLFGKTPFRPIPPTPSVQLENGAETVLTLKKHVQLSYIAMGLPTIGLGHPDVVALDLLADVLGGGTSARLYQRLREETQTVLSVSCDYIPFQQKGLFALFAEALPETAEKALDSLNKELLRIETTPIQQAELNRAKARIKSEWLHGSETPHGRANTLGSLAALGFIDFINIYLNQLETATVHDLMDAYKRHVAGRIFSVTRIDPDAS